MRGTLPEAVRTRGSKATFDDVIGVELGKRFQNHGIENLHAVRNGWVDASTLDRMYRGYVDGRRAGLHPRDIPNIASVWFAVAVDLWITAVLAA